MNSDKPTREKERKGIHVMDIESIIEKVMFAHHGDISMMDNANIADAAIKIMELINSNAVMKVEQQKCPICGGFYIKTVGK